MNTEQPEYDLGLAGLERNTVIFKQIRKKIILDTDSSDST
jgi:hypothetical protein